MTVIIDSQQQKEQAPVGETTKDPFMRLLDLTLGWGEYVERDEAEHPDILDSADIYAAYQSVAGFAEPYWEASPEAQEKAARQFVETHLLPLLLGNKP